MTDHSDLPEVPEATGVTEESYRAQAPRKLVKELDARA